MTELLYNKSKAVAALNKVEGFNPLELARRISNEGEAEQLYLDVKYRKLWFRLLNPTGKIISNIISLTENMAVVEARVYPKTPFIYFLRVKNSLQHLLSKSILFRRCADTTSVRRYT